MKPAIWRIFRNGRWSYSDSPSTRSEDRAAWQPLYAEQPTVQAEREACALLCVGHANLNKDILAPVTQFESGGYVMAEFLAESIRARGQG
jgi:hypothetical protein